MERHQIRHGLGAAMATIRRDAERRYGVPAASAAAASDVTARRLGWRVDPSTREGMERLTAYFWAVIRRSALSETTGRSALGDRFLVGALAADLHDGGHNEESIYEELLRQFGARVPAAVLESYRPPAHTVRAFA